MPWLQIYSWVPLFDAHVASITHKSNHKRKSLSSKMHYTNSRYFPCTGMQTFTALLQMVFKEYVRFKWSLLQALGRHRVKQHIAFNVWKISNWKVFIVMVKIYIEFEEFTKMKKYYTITFTKHVKYVIHLNRSSLFQLYREKFDITVIHFIVY